MKWPPSRKPFNVLAEDTGLFSYEKRFYWGNAPSPSPAGPAPTLPGCEKTLGRVMGVHAPRGRSSVNVSRRVYTRETSKWSGTRTSGHAEFPPQTQQDSNDEKLSSGKESTFN